MAELAADRSWLWFLHRFLHLTPESAFWRLWAAAQQHDPTAGPAPASQDKPAIVVDDDAGFEAFARRAGFKINKPEGGDD